MTFQPTTTLAPLAPPSSVCADGRRCRIAVIGSGISGAGAAYLLAAHHDVVLFEADARLGGHSNTVDVPKLGGQGDGGAIPVDTGFIVYNTVNYPHLTGLFDHLGVATERSDMSFAVSLDDGALEYTGSGFSGMFAQRRNLFRPGHWWMLVELLHFYRRAGALGGRDDLAEVSLGDLMTSLGYSKRFRNGHILPMAAAIWSTPFEEIMEFPAASFLSFFDNHGLFRLKRRPRWRTVAGGSREYVRRLNAAFAGRTRLATPVQAVERRPDGVLVKPLGLPAERFDHVVIATHADQALAMLAAPTEREAALLSAFRYEPNRAVLHRDPGFMPRRARCWASWNYLSYGPNVQGDSDGKLALTYWMNRLQNLDPADHIFVTLNPPREPAGMVADIEYTHPQYSRATLAAQRRLDEIQGIDRIWYCGAHMGHGFHEDGLKSAVDVAARFGIAPPWAAGAHAERPAAPCPEVVA